MPTRREYQEFTETLDKLLSDNLNRKFFERRMPTSTEDETIGTIALLERYFGFLQADDRTPIEDMLKTFRKVRSERSKSSHHDLEDKFDYAYNKKQRDIMRSAYTAIRLIRLAFSNAPDARGIEVPDWLYKGEINPD